MQNLDYSIKIVNSDGTPTEFFMRFLQDRGIGQEDISTEIAALLAKQIIAGNGLDGGGTLGSPGNITIDANASAILDLINSTQGAVLYRGASAWVALAPGTSGQFLKTNGAGANPEWAAGGSGGAVMEIPSFQSTAALAAQSGSAYATKATAIKPNKDIAMTHIACRLPQVSGASYQAHLITLSGSTIATVSSSTVLAAAGTIYDLLLFPISAYLVAGVSYYIAVTRTDSTTTYALPLTTSGGAYSVFAWEFRVLPISMLNVPGFVLASVLPAIGNAVTLLGAGSYGYNIGIVGIVEGSFSGLTQAQAQAISELQE